MRNPTVFKANEIRTWENYIRIERGYIPARPLPFYGIRLLHNLKLAYMVFIGKYDALDWEDN